jgi:pimeloyl-ACP methyl ester carboxylesterase
MMTTGAQVKEGISTTSAQSRRAKRGILWWVGRVLLGLVALMVLIAGIILAVGAVVRANLLARYQPIGQMVDVGGYKLHIYCQGSGGPAVVMDTGAGMTGLHWGLVQPEVAKTTQVCVYDRAGLGWSEPSPRPRTNLVMAEELYTLLKNAGIPGPYVLVGHSLGGLNARVFAHKYPKEVAGLVLVDAAHEEQYVPETMQNVVQKMQAMFNSPVFKLMYKTGVSVLISARDAANSRLPKDVAQADGAIRSTEKHFNGAVAETQALLEAHAQVRAEAITDLGDLPLIVIQHGQVQPQMFAEVTELMEEINRTLQPQVAKQSRNGKLVIAENSGHDIAVDEPELVVQSIMEVLAVVH